MRRQAEDRLLSIWSHRGAASTLLLPLAWAYGYFSERRLRAQARRAWRAPVPVIVVGNILVGGTGKTPVTAAVCEALQSFGRSPGIVSRGYGTRVGREPRLSRDGATAEHLGDEPALLHAATGAPVAVHPCRSRAAQALLARHPDIDVLIADDGLQHRALARDVEIIVQDARGTGNGRLLPAGPLREPPSRLAQADWLVTQLGADEAPAKTGAEKPTGRSPRQVTMRLHPTRCERLTDGQTLTWAQWQTRHATTTCSAVAGIGHPERFFAMLRAEGLPLGHTLALPDHGVLTAGVLNTLPDTPILITAKDAVKCTGFADPRLWVVHVAPQFDDAAWLTDLNDALHQEAAASLPSPHKGDDRH
ncbi:Tetraacyldisaccharide 4'-kinase OS=Castellaniella defragrans OX=75697 GN=lpxK PE=3 SV=1 [Castellaniella defragrans]